MKSLYFEIQFENTLPTLNAVFCRQTENSIGGRFIVMCIQTNGSDFVAVHKDESCFIVIATWKRSAISGESSVHSMKGRTVMTATEDGCAEISEVMSETKGRHLVTP